MPGVKNGQEVLNMSQLKTLKIKVSGLHCKACELLSEEKLSSLPGVKAVRVSHSRGQAEIDYTGDSPDLNKIRQALQKLGYDLSDGTKKKKSKLNSKEWRDLFWALAIATGIGLILKFSGWGNLQANIGAENLSLGGVWLIGLVAGLSTCMALVGGILVALAADYAKKHPEASRFRKFQPHLYFNLGRIVGFFLLGGVLGILGSFLKISSLASSWLSLIIGILIIFLGLQVIDIFPALRRFSFTLPKGITKIIPTNTKNRHYHPAGAMIAGTLSFFIPCGFTQSMQVYALSSGEFIRGGLVMATFALGTAIGFLSLGGLVSLIKGKQRGLFLKTAGLIVVIFGIFNFYNAYKVLRLHAENGPITKTSTQDGNNQLKTQIIQMEQNGQGYSPNHFQVEVGRPVRWVINSTVPYSCASSLVVPSLKLNKQLKPGENTIEFTPEQTGQIKFTCSMGMYSGVIEVLKTEELNNGDKRIETKINDENLPVCNINGCN